MAIYIFFAPPMAAPALSFELDVAAPALFFELDVAAPALSFELDVAAPALFFELDVAAPALSFELDVAATFASALDVFVFLNVPFAYSFNLKVCISMLTDALNALALPSANLLFAASVMRAVCFFSFSRTGRDVLGTYPSERLGV